MSEKYEKNQKHWKTKDERYIKELQKLFDLIDNVEDEKLKKNILEQVVKFDNVLTQIIEDKYTKH